MTQEATPVSGEAPAPVETEAKDPFAALAEEMTGPDEPEDEEIPEELDEAEADEVEAEEDEAEAIEAEEELPPIDAPNSWDGEAKEEFKKLPRALQETVQKREAEREKFVQAKSQEAAQAQRNAQVEAMKAVDTLREQAVQHLQQYAKQFEVSPPSAELFSRDPVAYAQQLETYQHATAQREKAQRDAEAIERQRQADEPVLRAQQAQAFVQQLAAEVPELVDPQTGQTNTELHSVLTATAVELGFDPDQISGVTAIKALKLTSEWKSKSEKYDALMKKQMERVRSGKAPPPIAKPGTARLPEQTRKVRSDTAWNQALEGARSGNRNARDQGFADWAVTSGFFD